MLRRITCSFVAIVVAGCGHGAGPPRDAAADRSAIVAALQQWPRDFNAKDLAVCALFEDDVVVAYPGGPDNGRPAFCQKMQRLFSDPEKRYSYAEPEIREVLVDGDLATVRLIWTLSIKDALDKLLEEFPEDGVDVFRRQPDGSWKIHISHAFSVRDPAGTAAP